MGAGSFPAGMGGAGVDPSYVPLSAPAYTPPRALMFDPRVRQFVQNADGSMADVHPVDAQVVYLLFFEAKSSPSQPALGTRIRKRITRVNPKQIPAIVLDEVKTTLGKLIAAGDITLVSVTVDQNSPGAVFYTVSYVNLRDPATDVRNPLATSVRVVA